MHHHRSRSAGVLLITLVVAILAAAVISAILAQFIDPTNVVHKALVNSFQYDTGDLTINLIILKLRFALSISINLLTVLSMLAAYYYWKYRI